MTRAPGDPRPSWWPRAPGLALAISVCILTLATPATVAQDGSAPSPSPAPATDGTFELGQRTYRQVGPTIVIVLDEAWRERPALEGPIVTFERPDMPGGVLSITRFDGDVFVDSCDPTSMTWLEPSAEALIAILAGNPWLDAEDRVPVEVGGRAGIALDVSTPPIGAGECALPFLLVWAVPMAGGEFVQEPGQRSRFIAVDAGPDVLVIAIETVAGIPFAPFAAEAMRLLESMAIVTR